MRTSLGLDKTPIVPFTWYDLYTQHCAKGPPVGLGHCPLMRSPVDLHAEFALARDAGAGVSGMIIWGSHGDVRPNTTDCVKFRTYLNTTLGPYLAKLAA